MVTAAGQEQQAKEIAQKLAAGATPQELAIQYGISRITVWRRANQGAKYVLPDKDDTDEWRDLLTATLTDRIVAASEKGDDKALVALVDRLSRLNGFDHTARMDVARLRLDAARLELLAERMTTALDTAGVPVAQRKRVLELIARDG